MLGELFWAAGAVQYELLLFCAIWFALGAVDDLLIDIGWVARSLWRRCTIYTRHRPMRAERLPPLMGPEPRLAIFVAAWDEAGCIGAMLRETAARWRGQAYRLYVGCYANDPATVAEAMSAAQGEPAIRVVLHRAHGPTSKADCLNRLWRAFAADQAREGELMRAIVLHDAEDMVDPYALRLFDMLLDRADLIQLPVVPLRVPGSRWVSGHYCDEFAEAHGKQMVVREAIGAGVPSAGVGCAIAVPMLTRIAAQRGGDPFDASSLTEDYELGLGVRAMGGRPMHVRMRDAAGALVATRAYFPASLDSAVRQKSRWLAGIALAGWDRLGWSGGVAELWMRLRDRRATFAALVLGVAYAAVVVSGLVLLGQALGYPPPPPLGAALWGLLAFNGAMLLLRLAMRAAFVRAEHGWGEALLSIPRAFVSNLVAVLAARRAVMLYARHCLGGALIWEKTRHHFPGQPG